jgi:hypothetical protein
VLGIFGILTKEMKQGRTSEPIPDDTLPVAESDSEKYLKKLIGRRDVEDALIRLDRLTQEEAWKATAQVLKVTHRVNIVEEQVKGVDVRVKEVDDKVGVAIASSSVFSAQNDLAISNHTFIGNEISSTLTSMSPSNFQLIIDAFDDYARQVGVDLTKNPLADALRGCDSPNAVLELLQDKANAFKTYRDGDRTLINWLKPVVQVVHGFSGVLGPAISLVSRTR